IGVLIPSVILHEISHGAVALAFGDDTAQRAGRLTLNPIPHIDPFGTVILPALLILSGVPAFGYAKPVPVNLRNLRNPRQQGLLVSLAGPATNITLAVAGALALRIWFGRAPYFGDSIPLEALLGLGIYNVYLAVFNLLPIPPLDGSALVERLLPTRWWPQWLRFRQYSMGLLLLLFLWGGHYGRVVATLAGAAAGHDMAKEWSKRTGITRRVGLYLRHAELGGDMLALAGSDSQTEAWARQHHSPPDTWTVPRDVADALKAA